METHSLPLLLNRGKGPGTQNASVRFSKGVWDEGASPPGS